MKNRYLVIFAIAATGLVNQSFLAVPKITTVNESVQTSAPAAGAAGVDLSNVAQGSYGQVVGGINGKLGTVYIGSSNANSVPAVDSGSNSVSDAVLHSGSSNETEVPYDEAQNVDTTDGAVPICTTADTTGGAYYATVGAGTNGKLGAFYSGSSNANSASTNSVPIVVGAQVGTQALAPAEDQAADSDSTVQVNIAQRISNLGQSIKANAALAAGVIAMEVQSSWAWMKHKVESGIVAVKNVFSSKDSSEEDQSSEAEISAVVEPAADQPVGDETASSIPALDPTSGSTDTLDDSF